MPYNFIIALTLTAASVDGSASRVHQEIRQLLDDGSLGGLSEVESVEVNNTLTWLSAAAGCADPVSLNQPIAPGRLNVYTTRPAAYSVTKCGPGNALYDPQIDAIFIDLDVIFPARLKPMYGDVMVVTSRTPGAREGSTQVLGHYLRFIFLHELGHRMLHRDLGVKMDLGPVSAREAGQKREQEADAFAIKAMQAAYVHDLARGGKMVGDPPKATFYVPMVVTDIEGGPGDGPVKIIRRPLIKPEERVFVDLSAMIYETSYSLLFSDVPYSPYYRDAEHPTFVERSLGLLAQAEARSGDPNVRSYLALAGEFLNRIKTVGEKPLAEIHVKEPIHTVRFDGQGVIVVTKKGSIARTTYRRIIDVLNGDEPNPLRTELVHVVNEPAGTFSDPPWILGNRQLGTLLYDRKSGVFSRLDGTRWGVDPLPPDSQHHSFRWTYPLAQPPQGLLVIGDQSIGDAKFSLRVLRRGEVVAHTSLAEVSRAAVQRGAPLDAEWRIVQSGDEGIDLAAWKNIPRPPVDGHRLLGMASLDPARLQLRNFTSVRINEVVNDLAWPNGPSVYRQAGVDEYYAVGTTFRYGDKHDHPYEFCVWRLSSSDAPKLVATYPLSLEKLPIGAESTHWFTESTIITTSTEVIPQIGIIVSLLTDSVYRFQPSSRRASLLFHPGGVHVSSVERGLVALYARGSSKCYVVQVE